jgi:hypothetical protein
MKVIRQALPPLVAAILLCVATVLILLALDVRSWQRTLGRDDARFEARPSETKLWQSPGLLPGDPAGALLGVGDPVAYRTALQGFWASAVGIEKARASTPDLSAARVATQAQLQSLATYAKTAAERSSAANQLGVMTITTTAIDHATLLQILDRAAAYFQTAIKDDPTNWPAKANLELVLRVTRPGKSRFNADAQGGFGSGGSYGTSPVGGGF